MSRGLWLFLFIFKFIYPGQQSLILLIGNECSPLFFRFKRGLRAISLHLCGGFINNFTLDNFLPNIICPAFHHSFPGTGLFIECRGLTVTRPRNLPSFIINYKSHYFLSSVTLMVLFMAFIVPTSSPFLASIV